MKKSEEVVSEKNPITYVFGQYHNREVTVALGGETSILSCRKKPDDPKGNTGTTKKVYTPKEECEGRLYTDDDGPYVPAKWLEKAFADAGVHFIYKGRKTYKKIIPAGIRVFPDKIRLNVDWEVNSENVHVPPGINNPVILRHRPEFKDWEISFTIQVRDESIDLNILAGIVERAGRFLGIGDWRHRHGLYKVIKFELVQ